MNSSGSRKGMQTKLIAWKAKLYDLTRKVASHGFKERENVLPNIQVPNMPITEMSSRMEQQKIEIRTQWTPQGKNSDNGLADMRCNYVRRPRLSWTGLYGKEPWPRERKQWEKV